MTIGYFFDELYIDQSDFLSKTITEAVVQRYAALSLDRNPIHLHEALAKPSCFGGRVVHGMLSCGLISALLGIHLPGPRTIYLNQSLRFRAPVRIGSTVTARVEITDLKPAGKRATLRTRCLVEEEVVIDGEACVLVSARL